MDNIYVIWKMAVLGCVFMSIFLGFIFQHTHDMSWNSSYIFIKLIVYIFDFLYLRKKMVDFFFIVTDSVFLHLRSNTIRVGQSRTVLICGSDSLGEIAQMVFEFRQNISDEWRSFLKVNESGSFSEWYY